jgi:predicted peroxiredoxin
VAGLLIVTATGPDDHTRASVPFHIAANGARPIDVEASVVFAGDAAELVKPQVIAEVRGVGVPPLRDLVDKCVAQNVRFYV